MPPTPISQLAGRWRRNLNKAIHTHTKPIAKRLMGVSARFCTETDRDTKKNEVVWATGSNRVSIAAGGLCWTWNRAQSIGIAPAHHQPVASAVSSLRTGSFLDFWKMLSSTTMTCSSSPPRSRPPLLKIGALRPQWPQMYPPNFQRLKLVPSTTRSRHPLPALYRPGPWGTHRAKLHRAKLPPMILLPPMLTKPVYVAWPLARPHSRA